MAGAPIEYSETVLEHFRKPRNAGVFPTGTPDVIEGSAGNRRQGREISLALRLEAGRVVECRYRAYGCPATIALCSVMSERLKGRILQECRQMSGIALAEELELPPAKRAAALLLEDALEAAFARYNMTSKLQPA